MKKSRNLWITTLALGLILLLLSISDWDFYVSKAIINKDSIFGEIFNRLGELPAFMALLVGTAILYGSRRKDILWRNILGTAIAMPFMGLISFAIVFMPVRYTYEFDEAGIPNELYIPMLIIAILIFGLCQFFIYKMGADKLKYYRKHGFILLILAITEMIVVNVLKIIWARPRMRSIETIEQFRRWYEINGPMNAEEFKSFPSGHTANGFMSIAYIMFIPKDKKKLRSIATGIAVTWGICVAISRVLLGAHFLSDVFVGGYVTMLLYYFYEMVILNRKAKA